jgi:radical SAM superfamily enzyme YgiQ (UPF0313 family)
MNILLLNPPGTHAFVRDYYCSKVSKSNYLFHPVDLLTLSGILSQRHTISVIDAIADRLTEVVFLQRFEEVKPDVVISLVGAVSLDSDLGILKKLTSSGSRILVSGDVFLDDPQRWLERCSFIEAVILDFSSDDILAYLDGAGDAITPTIVSRFNSETQPLIRARREEFFLPVPRHELFNSPNYNFPFVRHKSFATVLTDYGCPFPCTFCVMATLGYRYRSIESVIAEFHHLKQLGKREIFFMDQTFGTIRSRALEMCRVMQEEQFGFGWVCYSRVDLADLQLLTAMRDAGCHTIIFGVESGSDSILKLYQKGYTRQQISAAFALCRDLGIRTVATFIIGLPDETLRTAMETVDFLKDIQCDFASFNIAVPRAGTPLRSEAIRLGLTDSSTITMDQSGATVIMPSKHLTTNEIMALKSLALRRFYLRPAYLLRRLLKLKNWYELKEQIREGYHLLKDH